MGEARYTCPSCNKENVIRSPVRYDTTAAKLAESNITTDGDLTCCAQCKVVLKYDKDHWRVITDEEWLALPVEERSFLKRAQEATHKSGKAGLKERIRDLTRRSPEAAMALPWLIAARLLSREVPTNRSDLIKRGLTHVGEAILKRPDTDVADDTMTIIPVIMAQAYIDKGGDLDATQALLAERAEKECIEAGMPESLLAELRELLK